MSNMVLPFPPLIDLFMLNPALSLNFENTVDLDQLSSDYGWKIVDWDVKNQHKQK